MATRDTQPVAVIPLRKGGFKFYPFSVDAVACFGEYLRFVKQQKMLRLENELRDWENYRNEERANLCQQLKKKPNGR